MKVLDKNNGKKRDENIAFLFDFAMSDSVTMHLKDALECAL